LLDRTTKVSSRKAPRQVDQHRLASVERTRVGVPREHELLGRRIEIVPSASAADVRGILGSARASRTCRVATHHGMPIRPAGHETTDPCPSRRCAPRRSDLRHAPRAFDLDDAGRMLELFEILGEIAVRQSGDVVGGVFLGGGSKAAHDATLPNALSSVRDICHICEKDPSRFDGATATATARREAVAAVGDQTTSAAPRPARCS
jgi:hypothetical protein